MIQNITAILQLITKYHSNISLYYQILRSRAGMMGMGEVGMTVGRVRGEAGGRVRLAILGRTCLWRTVSDSISGARNCTATRRSSAHWPVMSEGSKHVCSINSCIRSWLEIFPPM